MLAKSFTKRVTQIMLLKSFAERVTQIMLANYVRHNKDCTTKIPPQRTPNKDCIETQFGVHAQVSKKHRNSKKNDPNFQIF